MIKRRRGHDEGMLKDMINVREGERVAWSYSKRRNLEMLKGESHAL
jgi:hypothetical protein